MEIFKLSHLLDGDLGGEEDLLRCPHCISEYTTHTWIDVFNVGSQYHDGIVYSISPESDGTKWNSVLKQHKESMGNPSESGSHGILLGFDCGNCSGCFALKIGHHKGHTALSLEKDT